MKTQKPVIIPRSEHPISRSLVSPNAIKVLYRLRENGFIAYLVGGCVRDLLLGREPKDFDVVTNATPNQVKKVFRNCRLIGRRFRLAHLHFHDEIIEVATFRSSQPEEVEIDAEKAEAAAAGPDADRHRPPRHLRSEEGVILRDNVFGTPAEDALRRDFTVNALIYDIADFSIIDHVGGMADLERGVIRTIGDPRVRFTEDPVRMLRAARFAAMLGFAMEAETWEAILELAPTITRSAPPRLYEEILKLFLLGEGEKNYQLLRQTGLFDHLFPSFSRWLERETDGFPHAWISRALEWVDGRIGGGIKVSPPLLIALLFSEYLEEKASFFRQEGCPHQEALNLSIAEFLGELAPTVLIPHKTGLAVRDILASLHRFRKIPGKRATVFVARPGFGDALDYLRFVSEVTGEERKICVWWEKFAQENPVPQAGEGAARDGAVPKRRPRRRRSGRSRRPAPAS